MSTALRGALKQPLLGCAARLQQVFSNLFEQAKSRSRTVTFTFVVHCWAPLTALQEARAQLARAPVAVFAGSLRQRAQCRSRQTASAPAVHARIDTQRIMHERVHIERMATGVHEPARRRGRDR